MVIRTKVKSCFGKHLNSYHVLKDKEVYSELPYKSSWLNVNEQLDDIDKEFDFPQSLKHHLLRLKSDSQPDQVETEDIISAQCVNEVSNKMLSSTELKQVDPSEEKQDSSVEATELKQVDPSEEKQDSSVEATELKQVAPSEEKQDSSVEATELKQIDPSEEKQDSSVEATELKQVAPSEEKQDSSVEATALKQVDPSEEKQDSSVEATELKQVAPSEEKQDSSVEAMELKQVAPSEEKQDSSVEATALKQVDPSEEKQDSSVEATELKQVAPSEEKQDSSVEATALKQVDPSEEKQDSSVEATELKQVAPSEEKQDSSVEATALKQGDPSEERHDSSVEATEIKQVAPSEEKQDSSVEATSTQTASPNKTERADSSDPYSFKIQVFPPEDAKVIFEQAQRNLPSMDMDSEPERALNSSVAGELPKWSLKKAGTIGPADTEELPVSSVMRILRRKTKPCTSLSSRRSLTEELKCEEEKTEKRTVMLNQPADLERNNDENGRNANNDALKFTVLPVSFNFGSNGIKETTDPVPGKPDLVEGKDNSHNKTGMERGSWYPIAETERSFPSATPKTYSLFHTFQEKYMKTIQPNVNK
ncbi:hypothetical protein VZT92_024866 [Zoarces viviparus]|uniref:Uncharacterized protein n=1 Tax=Zoarces viviparus TaxID=48416 RepID=A0AAW1E436_ZOAVI